MAHAKEGAMSETTHTPGPWKIEQCEYDELYVNTYIGPAMMAIDNDADAQKTERYREAMANAALIARAPELAAENAALRAENAELLAALNWVIGVAVPLRDDWTCRGCNQRKEQVFGVTVHNASYHAPDCPWRVATELRDRLTKGGT